MIRSQFALLLLCVVTLVTAVRDTGGKQEHGQEIWKNRGKCSTNMCQNGGQCMDRSDYYDPLLTCRCPPEWTGRFCEDDVDECLLDPTVCKNGGTCVNFPGGHSCACVNGWSGVDCTENIDDCLSSACASGSTCVDRVASFFCLCQPGRTGLLCHIDDACIRNPCGKGQECLTNPINGRAICFTPANTRVIPPVETEVLNSTLTDTGEEGKEVWINRGNCSDNLCQKGSQCLDRGDQYTCRCPPQWTGRFCEDDVDECLLDPTVCKNGGTCVNFPGGHSCACVNGWSGVDCSENIDDCLSSACASGSTCVDRVASFFCLCQPGRTGLLCHLVDVCIRNPCAEGQHCETNPINGRAICYD
ncbi:neurogenic locus notch homolog protein 1-like isoform X2 [Pygocentrus nattereri]|uniref:neurogenic locus notch homolog protein 1-like isoform X2 n=1 Tax=Pygocentrus nattereri TaxID=42514 RepID=UPI00081491EB|nr:neurogenic locus notch homolog protein 1-like isoform X2 [Pygocentrus nattereri]